MTYTSSLEVESKVIPGVRFRLRRVSFGRRLELAHMLQEQLEDIQRLSLAPESAARATETALLSAEIDAIHLRWGVASIEGLEIDGSPATADSLIESGPEELVREILTAVRRETGLDEEERKNFGPPSTSCADEQTRRAMRGSAANVSATGCTANATAGASSPMSSSLTIPASSGDGAIPLAS